MANSKNPSAEFPLWYLLIFSRRSLIFKNNYLNGLFRQNLNGTGTGTGTGTIGFIEYYAGNSHCSGTGTGTGIGNLTNGFQTHFLQLTRSPYGTL